MVYIPNSRALKNDFWNELRFVRNLSSSSWIICGNFNDIFSLNDKNKGIPNLMDLSDAQNLLNNLNIIDPHPSPFMDEGSLGQMDK